MCIRACLPLEKHLIVVLERVNVLIVQALYGKVQLVERRLLIKVVVLVPGAGQRRVVVDSVPGRLPVGVGDVTDCLPRLFLCMRKEASAVGLSLPTRLEHIV